MSVFDALSGLFAMLSPCRLCPNLCMAARATGGKGACGLGRDIAVSAAQLHFGEERELVGAGGSGTVFFTGCNMKCVYCQNSDISQDMRGDVVSEKRLAGIFLELQNAGAENINLVTPTPQVPMIFAALAAAKDRGLRVPVVYNCGGYESAGALRLLSGMVDIYMPDLKYGDNAAGLAYSGVKGYFDAARAAIKEMHSQVGDLALDGRGVAKRGLLVRHLVLPGGLAGSRRVLDFIAREVSAGTFVNIMRQYHPAHRAHEFKWLSGSDVRGEYLEAVEYARGIGLRRGYP